MKQSTPLSLALAIIIIVWAAYPASAEIYQYKDDSGNTHYTNDPVGIPKQYQKNVNIQGETVIYPEGSAEAPLPESVTNQEAAGDQEEAGDQEAETGGDQGRPATGQVRQPQGNLNEVDSLRARETAFNDEFKALQEERRLLDEAMKKAKTKEDLEKVNEATVQFNLKFKDFHQRRQTFKEEVAKYNDQVKQDMEQKLEQYQADQAARSQGGASPESE
ncbi:MAG: DUF4124 domain-containing protein [Thermodesulfobacteriota bacterium]